MNIALECQTGISGNMFVGAMLDGGLPFEMLKEPLKKLPISHYRLIHKKVITKNVSATYFNVDFYGKKASKTYTFLETIEGIQKSDLSSSVKSHVCHMLENYFRVKNRDFVFSEKDRCDTLIDFIEAAIAVEYFGIKKIFVSELFCGNGVMRTKSGRVFAVPCKEVIALLGSRFHLQKRNISSQLITTTGACILKEFANGEATNYEKVETWKSCGSSEFEIPNVLRIHVLKDQTIR